MPLRVVRRKQTGALTITGPDPLNPGKRIQQRAKSDDPKLAAEEAAALEAELRRTLWHGERRGSRSFAQALESYLGAEARSQSTKDSLCRILLALGRDLSLNQVDQQTAISLRRQLMGGRTVVTATGKTRVIPPATDASYRRHIVVPLKAVLNHAFELGWAMPRARRRRALTRVAPTFSILRRPSGLSPPPTRCCSLS